MTVVKCYIKRYCDDSIKPVWRGYLHKYSIYAIFPFHLMLLAITYHTPIFWYGFIFALGTACCYLASSTYHTTDWHNLAVESIWQKIDHAGAIFSIFCSVNFISVLVDPTNQIIMQAANSFFFIITMLVMIFSFDRNYHLYLEAFQVLAGHLAYFGWCTHMWTVPWLTANIVVMSIGGAFYFLKPSWPYLNSFGYHEVFHVGLVINTLITTRIWIGLTLCI